MGYGIKIKKANGDEIISENKRPLVIIAVIDATHSMNDEPTILANSFLIDGLSLSVTPVTIVTNYSEFILSGDIFLDKNLTFKGASNILFIFKFVLLYTFSLPLIS